MKTNEIQHTHKVKFANTHSPLGSWFLYWDTSCSRASDSLVSFVRRAGSVSRMWFTSCWFSVFCR